MEARPRVIRHYRTENNDIPFRAWVDGLGDKKTQAIILRRVDRVGAGNFGDSKHIGEGVFELRIDHGPGYRVYFGQDGDSIILLWGGDKSTQGKDIKTAKTFWEDYNA